jgi:uncharacterized membrane protein HdeD (DUF308 family)
MHKTSVDEMKYAIRNWWLSLVSGILLIVSGLWILATPVQSFVALAVLFSFLTLASGISEIIISLTNRNYQGWGWYLTNGIVDLIIGIMLVVHPLLSVELLPFLVGFWVMFRGSMAIGSALELKSYNIEGWGIFLFTGIATVLFSLLILFHPILGSISVVFVTSMAFIAAGLFRVYVGLKLKNLHKLYKAHY